MAWLFTTRNGKVTLVVAALALPMFALSLFREFFTLIVVSGALTMIMIPIVDNFENRGMKRQVAIGLTFAVIVGSVGAIAGISYPIMLKQFTQMEKAFGVQRAAIGDSVYVRLTSHKILQGVLRTHNDTSVTITEFPGGDILEWILPDVASIFRVGDSVIATSHDGKKNEGVLRPYFVLMQENSYYTFTGDDNIAPKLNPFKEKLSVFEINLQKNFSFLQDADINAFIDSFIYSALEKIQKALMNIKTLLGTLVIVPMVTFLFLRDYHNSLKKFIRSIPNKYFEMTLNLISSLEVQIGKYIRGVCIEFFIVSFLAVLGYSLVGLHFAFVLGVAVGLFNVIPLIGPYLGTLPAMFVSITQFGDMSLFAPVVLINVLVQGVDVWYVKPKLYGNFYRAHPLMVLIMVLLGGQVMGFSGAIMAVPIFTTLAVTARETQWGLSQYQITNQ
jgi:predicted PurR-regulated permease PerM